MSKFSLLLLKQIWTLFSFYFEAKQNNDPFTTCRIDDAVTQLRNMSRDAQIMKSLAPTIFFLWENSFHILFSRSTHKNSSFKVESKLIQAF